MSLRSPEAKGGVVAAIDFLVRALAFGGVVSLRLAERQVQMAIAQEIAATKPVKDGA